MFSPENLMVPVEFNEVCREAVMFSSVLARRFAARLTAVHVVPEPDAVMGLNMDEGSRTRNCLEFEKFLAQAGEPALNRVLLEGDPASEIVRFAHQSQCDMILMPTRGRGLIRRFLPGSVTARVLHDASPPVWTGVHPETMTAEGEFSIRRIAAAVDMGPQTRATLRWAGDAAEAFGAELITVHVLPHVPDASWSSRVEELAREQLDTFLTGLSLRGEPHFVIGPVAGRIAEVTAGLGCDLCVVGRGHMSSSARLGGHAYSIIRDSLCPVVSI
jgi:nucleotide-binding universal stress UspA family protein